MRQFLVPALAAASLALAGAASAQNVGIATSNPGSVYHNIGTAIAKIASEAGLATTIQPATSPNQYIPVVNAGEIQFGVCNLQELTDAYKGTAHFDGRPHADLRLVGLHYPLRVAFFVKKDSDIRTIADLKGKRMPDGFTAQKVILPLLDAQYATAGMTRADVTGVQVPSVVAGGNAFTSGETDGFFFALGAGKVREADAAVGGIRALSIDNTAENLAAIRKHFPVAYLTEVAPGPANPGILEPITVMAYPQTVFASSHTSDDEVYAMTKAIYEGKEKLAGIFPPFRNFDPAKMVGDVGDVQYHPGAVKFYKEVGLMK
jgi:hypothetical protein